MPVVRIVRWTNCERVAFAICICLGIMVLAKAAVVFQYADAERVIVVEISHCDNSGGAFGCQRESE